MGKEARSKGSYEERKAKAIKRNADAYAKGILDEHNRWNALSEEEQEAERQKERRTKKALLALAKWGGITSI